MSTYQKPQHRNMSLDKGILLLLIFGIVFYFLRRRHHLCGSFSPPLKEDYREFWNVLEASIADYREKMLPYIINQQIIAGHYPQHILSSLEDRYGMSGGSPWLSLPQEWQGRSAFGIRAWMEYRNLPFDESMPALHQLEILLEREAASEANAILESAIKT